MKVGFATADWSASIVEEDNVPAMGGSGWIRIGQYSPHLDVDHVIGVLVYHKKEHIFGVTDPKGNHHLDCDIIYMQRWMLKGIPESVRSARKSGQIVVNDLDDWYWGMHHRHFAKNYIDPSQNPDENIAIYRNVISASDLVVVSTPFLADKAKKELGATKVVMLENCVDFSAYTPRQHTDDGPTIIGWYGSTAHRSGDLDYLADVFPLLDPDQFAFHHTGFSSNHPPFWEEVKIKQEQVTLFPLVSPRNLPKTFRFDVGIAPLRDIPFNHAKSWIKPLEYCAAGIPFVASKSPEYRRFKEKYGVGRLASKHHDWMKHFKRLANPETRNEEALANLEALQSLDVKQGALRLTKILESII